MSRPSGLRAHQALLVACATSRVTEASRHAVDAALSLPALDWPAAVRASVRHGMAQHLALHLGARAEDRRIPPEVRACLERLYAGNRRRNAVLFRETAGLVQALRAAGVRCLVVKGVALALTVYPDPALRSFADIDLLVDAAAFPRAVDVARELGFRPLSPDPDQVVYEGGRRCPEDLLAETLVPEYDPAHRTEALAGARHLAKTELHRRLFRDGSGRGRDVDLAPFWSTARVAALPDGTAFLHPAPEPTLVHLAANAADHGFHRLLYALDLAETSRRFAPVLDWELVAALASRCGIEGRLSAALGLVRRELGAPVPETLPLREEGPELTLERVLWGMEAGLSGVHLGRLRFARSPRAKAALIWKLAVPSREAMRERYGARSLPALAACYLYRPVELAVRAVGDVLRARRVAEGRDGRRGE